MKFKARRGWLPPLLLAVLLLIGGCDGFGAIGNKQDYATKQAPLAYKSQGSATVLAFDQRPYVLSGEHDADFVGLQLNTYGIPFSVKTKSGRAFAADVTDAFTRSLASGGIAARSIAMPEDDDEARKITLPQARAMLLKDHARHALLVQITQWESSTYKYTTLEFDLTATIFDAAGKVLVSKRIKGSDELGGQIFGASRKARKVSADSLPLKIDELLNAPEVRAVLMS